MLDHGAQHRAQLLKGHSLAFRTQVPTGPFIHLLPADIQAVFGNKPRPFRIAVCPVLCHHMRNIIARPIFGIKSKPETLFPLIRTLFNLGRTAFLIRENPSSHRLAALFLFQIHLHLNSTVQKLLQANPTYKRSVQTADSVKTKPVSNGADEFSVGNGKKIAVREYFQVFDRRPVQSIAITKPFCDRSSQLVLASGEFSTDYPGSTRCHFEITMNTAMHDFCMISILHQRPYESVDSVPAGITHS